MSVETRLLDGRVRIRRRPGAAGQLLRGALGVFLFVAAGTAVVYVLPILVPAVLDSVVVEPTSPTEYVTTGKSVFLDPTRPAVGVPTGNRATLLVVVPVLLYLAGLVGYGVQWRRTYDVRVTLPDGLVGWD